MDSRKSDSKYKQDAERVRRMKNPPDMQERIEKRRLRRQRRRRDEILRAVTYALMLAVLIGAAAFGVSRMVQSGIRKSVTLEAGAEITLDDFLSDPEEYRERTQFLTDISSIDIAKPGSYDLEIGLEDPGVGEKDVYSVKLVVQDTVAPAAQAKDVTVSLNVQPNAADCVENIEDVTEVTVAFAKEPDVSAEGDVSATVILTDEGGNATSLETTIHVIRDTTAPVIDGAEDLSVYVGDTVSYKKNVTVTDDHDENPTLTVDNSEVNLDAAGEYPVVYTAADAAGNQTQVTVTLTVEEKPEGYVETEEIYSMAETLIEEESIFDDSMTQMEKAAAIYNWTRSNIAYTGSSDKSHWTRGAYDGFNDRAGDCFTYYAVAKALLDVAGIENTDIVKSDTSHSSHYWSLINLGDGWYHFDATPRKGSGDNFFMLTDEELEDYSSDHNNSHVFDSSLYPERAGTSIQDLFDYDGSGLVEIVEEPETEESAAEEETESESGSE